jgi:hypothetical protein
LTFAGPGATDLESVLATTAKALDFFTADLLNGTKVYVLAVIEHGTRRIRVLGAASGSAKSALPETSMPSIMLDMMLGMVMS